MTLVINHALNEAKIQFARAAALFWMIIAVSLPGGEIRAQERLGGVQHPLLLDSVPAPVTDLPSYRAGIDYFEEVRSAPPGSMKTLLSQRGDSRPPGLTPLADYLPENNADHRDDGGGFSNLLPESAQAYWPASLWHGSGTAPAAVPPAGRAQTHRDEQMNFTYTPPDALWRIGFEKIDPDTRLTLHHTTAPEMYCAIGAMSLGPLAGLSPNQLVEVLKAGLKKSVTRMEVVRVEDRAVHGIEGKLMLTNADNGPLQFAYVYWLGTHGGTHYIFTMWSRREDGGKLLAAADSVLGGFRIIDPSRDIASPFTKAEFEYVSPASGFSLQMGPTGWRQDDAFLGLGLSAEVGIMHSNLTAMVVSVIPLRGETPPLPVAVRGMTALYGFIDAHQRIHDRKPVRNGDSEGVQFDFERMTENGVRRYRNQIFVKGDRAYLVCVSSHDQMFDEAIVDAALAQFRLDRPAAEFDPAALPVREQVNHARFFTGLGLYEFERRNFGVARGYFGVAEQIEPENPVHVENLVDTFVQEQRFREACEAIDARIDVMWDKGRLPAIHAALQIALGNNDQAITEFRQLFADGYWNEKDFIGLIEMVWARDGAETALEELETRDQDRSPGSPQLTALRGDLLVDVGRHEDAIALLKSGRKQAESNSSLVISLIAAYRDARREREALAVAEEVIAGPYADAGVWFQKGLTELELEHYHEAKLSLETANRLLPDVPEIKQMLALAGSLLGHGDTQAVSTPLDPVPLPGGVELASLSVIDPRRDESNAYAAWRIRAIEFRADEEFRKTTYVSLTPRDESAVEGLRTLEYTFNPLYEQMYFNRLDVFDADGKRIASTDRHDAYVTHQQSGIEATDELTLHVPVPALRPGHRIEVVVTTRDLAAPEEFPYHAKLFASSTPAGYEVLSVRGDVARVTWVGIDPVHKTDDELVWVQRHVPAVPYEDDQPAPLRFLPVVELADTGCRWTGEVEQYLDSIKSRLPTPNETRQLARQITESSQPEEIILALTEHVQSEFTYQALEFGRHTRVMASSETVIANKYGDCKDLSLLLWQMLQAHGITAHLALVHSSGEMTPDLETIDQCDHMVVYLPDAPGGHVLDPTDRWGNPRLPVPSNLGGSYAVVLDEADPRLVRLPDCPEDQFHRSIEATVRFAADRSVNIEQSVQFEGYHAAAVRSLLRYTSPEERENVIREQIVVSDRGVKVRSIAIENLHESQLPLVVRLTGTIRDALYDADDRFVGQIPLLARGHQLFADDEPQRRTPFAFKNPLTSRSLVRLIPPAGWEVQCRSDERPTGENDFVKWSLDQHREGDQLVLESFHRRHPGRFPAGRRTGYRDAINTAAAAVSPRIVLQPTASGGTTTDVSLIMPYDANMHEESEFAAGIGASH